MEVNGLHMIYLPHPRLSRQHVLERAVWLIHTLEHWTVSVRQEGAVEKAELAVHIERFTQQLTYSRPIVNAQVKTLMEGMAITEGMTVMTDNKESDKEGSMEAKDTLLAMDRLWSLSTKAFL